MASVRTAIETQAQPNDLTLSERVSSPMGGFWSKAPTNCNDVAGEAHLERRRKGSGFHRRK